MSNNDNNKNNNNNEEKDDNKNNEEEEEVTGLDEDEEIILELKSQDNEVFKIEKDVAMHSALIKTMWSGDQSEKEIPLPNVRGEILKKVIKFLEYHHKTPMKEIEKPLKSSNMREVSTVYLKVQEKKKNSKHKR